MSAALEVRGLEASLGDLEILRGVDLEVPFGEINVLMGPNGSGKSTLAHTLMGKSEYTTAGSAKVDGVEILGLPVDERARLGLFQSFQYPVVVPGVTLDELVEEMAEVSGNGADFAGRVERASELLRMAQFRHRSVNDGLSGGEKKRSEMFQLAIGNPKVAILDEVDSGLDIDAVREVAELVEALRSDTLGVLIITHYSRILRYMRPDRVHIMLQGRIVESGGPEIAETLEAEGYAELRRRHGVTAVAAEDVPDPFADL